jgi:hypothetical protein
MKLQQMLLVMLQQTSLTKLSMLKVSPLKIVTALEVADLHLAPVSCVMRIVVEV